MTEPPTRVPGTVIFRPLVELDPTFPRVQSVMAVKRMTDHGSFVEWDDGKKQWRWRLPDQADGGALYPIMTTVVLGELPNAAAKGGIGAYHICFTNVDGVVLGRLTGFRTMDVAYADVDGMLPDEAWAALVRRGVTIRRERVDSVPEFYRRHPDPTCRRRFGISWPIRGAAERLAAASRTGRVLAAKVAG